MKAKYKDKIAHLVSQLRFGIDPDIIMQGAPPNLASSEFLTNKEQGNWAEEIVYSAINNNSKDYIAVHYGRSEFMSAGEEGFKEFYRNYQEELNSIGKRPDLLIFKKNDIDTEEIDLYDANLVSKAIAAIEVRSSSFLAGKYAQFMFERNSKATAECIRLRDEIINGPLSELLKEKAPQIYDLLRSANVDTFRELDFRARS